MHPRHILLGTLSSIAIVALGGCGGQGGGKIVARVDGVGTITEAMLNHWSRVEPILVHELVPLHPAPKGLVPDPPRYTACIAYLRLASSQTGAPAAALTSAALKAACKRREDETQRVTLNKLISWEWTIGRGRAVGIRVTDAQVRRRLSEVIRGRSAYGANFARYLKLSEQTMTDMLFRSRVQLYEVTLSDKLATLANALPRSFTAQQRQHAIAELSTGLFATKRWVTRTSCRRGFVVSACNGYTGPEPAPDGAS
jgi:hypothetical protein